MKKDKSLWAKIRNAMIFAYIVVSPIYIEWVRFVFVDAAQSNDTAVVRSYLDAGMNPDTFTFIEGRTALYGAGVYEMKDTGTLLLNRGANPCDALSEAMDFGHIVVAQRLIAWGANRSLTEVQHRLLIEKAKANPDKEFLKLLTGSTVNPSNAIAQPTVNY